MDSACQYHTVNSFGLLDPGTIKHTSSKLRGLGGVVHITHKGHRTIHTSQGVIQLSPVYYTKGLDNNLVSVPTLNCIGTKVVFDKDEAYIEQNKCKIYLKKTDGLWALPEKQTNFAMINLRMSRGATADAEIWHRWFGHPGDRKLKHMIANGLPPRDAAGYTVIHCHTCQTTHPRRSPVPKTAERSGEAVVQVDYMPVGQNERGRKGEVGAYVFSDRSSKVLKAYPVTNASAEEAAQCLHKYCENTLPSLRKKIECIQTYAGTQFNTQEWSAEEAAQYLHKYCENTLPTLRKKIECIQTYAGTQFNTQEWKRICTKHGLKHRTCPVDHQTMNGQEERAIGILATYGATKGHERKQ